MKRIAMAALAMITLLAFTGCDLFGAKEETKKTAPVATLSTTWWIKGSFDGWKDSGADKHWLTVDSANNLSFVVSNLYAIDYEFVLVNGTTEVKYNSATNVTPDTQFTMGGTTDNVKWTAAKSSYKVAVDITTPAAPKVTLVSGAAAANAVTNAMLIAKLQIKGNQFSQIDGVAVAAWTATNPTTANTTATSVSWDILVDNYGGEFGFNALEGFVKSTAIDVSALAAAGNVTATGTELTSAAATNVSLSNTTKNGSTYTVKVTVDATKLIGAGRYVLTTTLKTLSATSWVFTPWTAVVINGNWDGTTWLEGQAATNSAGVWTKQITAGTTTVNFKPGKTGWSDSTNRVTQDAGSIALSGIAGGGNLSFTAVSGTTYTITVSFGGTFTSDNMPVVKVVTP